MQNLFAKFIKNYRPACEVAAYVDKARTYAENHLSDFENPESIIAAMVIAQAIRNTSHDLEDAILALNSTLDNKDFGDIESAIDKLEGAVADVASRL